MLIAIGLIALFWVPFLLWPRWSIPNRITDHTTHFTLAGYCAWDEYNAASLFRSSAKGDLKTVASFADDGSALYSENGTGAIVIETDGLLARVRIISGPHTGQRCWTLGSFLEDSRHYPATHS
jgi:hypothetical protein